MKAGREHRVPLSSRAVEILRQLGKLRVGDFVFPGQTRNKPLSNMAMEMILRRMNIQAATVHGFRSSFRDWAGNVSNFPREITETALAHVIGDKAEQAYRRSDALEKRRKTASCGHVVPGSPAGAFRSQASRRVLRQLPEDRGEGSPPCHSR
jgi:integrase